jgi:hypothetical protein
MMIIGAGGAGYLLPAVADARALHACVGANGLIRVASQCRGGESAVGLQVVPLARTASGSAHAAAARPASQLIRAHTITGRQVKSGSLPGSDITPGTLSASALSSQAIGAGLSMNNGSLSVSSTSLQTRINGKCPSGQAMNVINADGSVGCQPAGTNAADFTSVQARVTGTPCPSGQFITDVAQSGVATCAADSNLQARVTTLENEVSALRALLAGVTRNGTTLLLSGMNLQIQSGAGATDAHVNGLGNLIIGYNENPGSQTGSHNLVLGDGQSFTSYGSLVGGQNNTASGPFAAVLGERNAATAATSSVTGGEFNQATAPYASVSGGCSGIAGPGSIAIDPTCINFSPGLGYFAAVSGGVGNHATGNDAAILGGYVNSASGIESTISGGAVSTASGTDASVSGGDDNQANGDESSISGGESNVAGDPFSAISGGCDNITGGGTEPTGGCNASGLESVVGGKTNRANDLWASVSGGCDNLAGTFVSVSDACTVAGHFTGAESVSGGEGNYAETALASVSGGQGNVATGFSSSIAGGVGNETDNVWGSIAGGSHRALASSAAQAASEAGPTVFAP